MTADLHALYRQLPATCQLLRENSFAPLLRRYGRQRLVTLLRELSQQARQSIREQGTLPGWCRDWPSKAAACLAQDEQPALRGVFNLTGTLLHTNLGRAPQAPEAIAAVAHAMRHPVTLEYDTEQGARGHRDQALAALLCKLTGAQDACIVNNNAAAVLLMLAATAAGKKVLVSRGELVEIGGSFRIPDVMRQAACQLQEVGTTNRTHPQDYRQAIDDNVALIMKVHTSNYQITGFTRTVEVETLAQIANEHRLPLIVDLGAGALVDMRHYGLPKEPMPQAMLAAGASLVSFSGDKLCGGPQAGIIVGQKALIEQLQRHPLKRALRADKMTLAALDATLRLYLSPQTLARRLPVLRLLCRTPQDIHAQAQRLLPPLTARYGAHFLVEIRPSHSQIGSGALPADTLPGWSITFTPSTKSPQTLNLLAHRWRQLPTPVLSRRYQGRLWLDLRCLDTPGDEAALLDMLLQPDEQP